MRKKSISSQICGKNHHTGNVSVYIPMVINYAPGFG